MAKKLVVWWNSFSVLYCQLHFSPFLHHTLPPDCDPAECLQQRFSTFYSVVFLPWIAPGLSQKFSVSILHPEHFQNCRCFIMISCTYISLYLSGILHQHTAIHIVVQVLMKKPHRTCIHWLRKSPIKWWLNFLNRTQQMCLFYGIYCTSDYDCRTRNAHWIVHD